MYILEHWIGQIVETQIIFAVFICHQYFIRIIYFILNQSINTRRICILALRRMQKSVRSMGNNQNAAMLTRRDDLLKKSFLIFFAYKKYSRHFIKLIEPLMADRLPWRWFSYFSGPRQCYLLGSQWDSHKPPGFYLKYLKLCSKDEQSFSGAGTTCG